MMAERKIEKASLFEELVLKFNHATVKNKTVFFRLLSVSQKA